MVKELVERKSQKGEILDIEERNLLSVAYKNVVGSKRASWYDHIYKYQSLQSEHKYIKIIQENNIRRN